MQLRTKTLKRPFEEKMINSDKKTKTQHEYHNKNINYSSFFFRKDIIDKFTKSLINTVPANKISSFPLKNFYLYNIDDILENISQRGTFKTRFTNQSSEYQELKNKNIEKLIHFLSSNICEDTIGYNYVKTSVLNSISKNIFDIVIISNKNIEAIGLTDEDDNYKNNDETDYETDSDENDDYENYDDDDENNNESYTKLLNNSFNEEDEDEEYKSNYPVNTIDEILDFRLEGVVGFIIVELGECKQYPFSYSINLICTNKKAPTGSGSILMGLYLYTILSHPNKTNLKENISFPQGNAVLNINEKPNEEEVLIEVSFSSNEPLIPVQQYGILELASSYTNPGGLCMYEKFGFQYDKTMYGKNCFTDFRNLPMIIDFNTKPEYFKLTNEEKKQKILNITAGVDIGFLKSKICNIRDSFITSAGKFVKTDEQKLLGYLKTLKLIEEHDISSITVKSSNEFYTILANLFYTIKFINEPRSRTPYQERVEPIKPGNINDFINYLETPQANRTQKIDLTNLLRQLPVLKGGTIKKNKKTKNTKKIKKIKINKKTCKKN